MRARRRAGITACIARCALTAVSRRHLQVGFDYDFTIASYKTEVMGHTIYDLAKEHLVRAARSWRTRARARRVK